MIRDQRLALALRVAPWLITMLLVLAMVLRVRAFQSGQYWLDLSHQYFAAAALALALTPIILTGGIDLSVGSVTVLSSVVTGALWRDAGLPIEWALVGGVAAGLVAGLINGALVIAGVIPLVATLATRELFRGLAYTLSGDTPVTRFPPTLGDWWWTPIIGLPLPLWGIAGLFVATYLLVHHTWVGRMIYAIGDNEQAARFAGVPVRGVKLCLYGGCGLVAGLCGAAMVMKFGAAKADAEKSLELAAIAFVVLGGVRITGGAGHVRGTLLGIVTVSVIMAGMNWEAPNWRETVTGTLLIAVAIMNEVASRWALRRVT